MIINVNTIGQCVNESQELFSACTILKIPSGRMILVNCSESTQHHFLKNNINFNRVDIILITQLSFSYVSGLPGMIAMLLYKKREENPHITIVGPKGVEEYCNSIFEVTDTFFRKIGMTYIEIDSTSNVYSNVTQLPVQGEKLALEISAISIEKNIIYYTVCFRSQSGLDEEMVRTLNLNGEQKKILGNRDSININDLTITYDMVKAKSRLQKLITIVSYSVNTMEQIPTIQQFIDTVVQQYSNTDNNSYSKVNIIVDHVTHNQYDHESDTHHLTIQQNPYTEIVTAPSLIIRVKWLPNGMNTLFGKHVQCVTTTALDSNKQYKQLTEKQEITKLKESVWSKSKQLIHCINPCENNLTINI
jgi:ribonuclease BN (tRNA processing enzyme)